MLDTSQQRESERVLRDSETRMRELIRATNDAVWDWNVDDNRVWWNEGLGTQFSRLGWSDAEALAANEAGDVPQAIASWDARIHPDDCARVVALLNDALRDGDTHEYRFRRDNGTYAYVFCRAHIIRKADGRAVRVI